MKSIVLIAGILVGCSMAGFIGSKQSVAVSLDIIESHFLLGDWASLLQRQLHHTTLGKFIR